MLSLHAGISRIVIAVMIGFLASACSKRAQTTQNAAGSTSPTRSAAMRTQQLFTARAADRTGQDMRMLIDEGTPDAAEQYYRQIESELGIKTNDNLDSVIEFCGFGGVTARQLELASPAELVGQFGPEVLSVRFFAPKIIDVSKPGGDFGWRKVVRLTVRQGSPAATRNVGAIFLLFNVFQPRSEVGKDPFEPCRTTPGRCSQNNQVMLVVKSPTPGGPTAYWLVFEAVSGGGKRTDHLNATFDGGDQASASSGSAVKAYHVPDACAQCHGGSQASAKLNVLDSDHWNDRIQPGDDFPEVGHSGQSVLFDAGGNPQSTQFGEVFTVLRSLNREIRDQIAGADADEFQLRAADVWLAVHKSSTDFAPPIARAFPARTPAEKSWSNTPADVTLLTSLNRYCYRCHSNVAYHVFDKQAVFVRRNNMASRLERTPAQPGGMPQDRRLDSAVVIDLAQWLRGLQ